PVWIVDYVCWAKGSYWATVPMVEIELKLSKPNGQIATSIGVNVSAPDLDPAVPCVRLEIAPVHEDIIGWAAAANHNEVCIDHAGRNDISDDPVPGHGSAESSSAIITYSDTGSIEEYHVIRIVPIDCHQAA